jgi:hypothetical protein
MAAHILKTGCQSLAVLAQDQARTSPEVAEDGALLPGRSAAAFGVALAAMLLVAAPALVAVVAIVSPGALDRVYGWLLGGSVAFSLVAAGRVPAAALLAFVLAGRRSDS